MYRLLILLSAVFILLHSCTKEKTDYEAERSKEIPTDSNYSSVFKKNLEGFEIELFSLNGKLVQGYNELKVNVKSLSNNQLIQADAVQLLPVLSLANNPYQSAPHTKELKFNISDNSHDGYIVFTELSTAQKAWELLLQIRIGQKTIQIKQQIQVEEQANKNLNMVAFTGADQEEYVIALIAPHAPKVAENKLLACIFQRDKEQEILFDDFRSIAISPYKISTSYRLALDPRMPEPSMGNHSSPNNKDLEQNKEDWYEGVVNYTMTGNWTLNFILYNQAGRILKGTPVPKDFTPGVAGKKSELFIDILF